MKPPRRIKVYFDGGCRPNPGPIEVAVVIRGQAFVFDGLGTGDNTDAEWLALNRALDLSRAHGLGAVDLIGDALEIVRAARRVLVDGTAANAHAAQFAARACQGPRPRVRWTKRTQNLAGIALNARHPR